MDTQFLYLLLGIGLVLVAVALLRRLQHRHATARDLTREQRARLRDQEQIRRSMEELLEQLEEVSRRINAQAETGIARLEQLIRGADRRIARLEHLQGAASGAGAATVATWNADRQEAEPRASARAAAAQEQWHTAASGQRQAEAQSLKPARPTPTAEPPSTAGQRLSPSKRQRVCEMADAGAAAMTIADALQMPLGEVELILNLRQFKPS